MRAFLPLIIAIFILISCKKENSGDSHSSSISSLPLADTALIKDTTIFFDVVIDGIENFKFNP